MNREALQREYTTATQGAGSMPLDGWTTVRVTGCDRATFLHNMCTNDVKSLSPGGGCEAFFTDVKGRIIAHAFILVREDSTLLVTVPEQAGNLMGRLDRYIIREDVQLADSSADLAWTLVGGLQAGAVVDQLWPAAAAQLSAPWSHAVCEFGETQYQLVRCDLPWCGGFLIGSPGESTDRLKLRLAELDVSEYSAAIWHAIRVESAWPLWGVDFDASNLPQEVNRDAAAIHFRKGCYLGQETVARIDALGHVNKKLVQVRFAGDEVPGVGVELLQGDQTAGQVTSSSWSPRFQAPLALAMVRRGANETGAMLQWNGVPAEVVEAPAPPTAA